MYGFINTLNNNAAAGLSVTPETSFQSSDCV